MKKATKGALAAAAAGTLMVGGAGSLAYWTGTGTVAGSTINSGKITIGSESCTGTGLHDWQYGSDDAAFSGSTSKVVPGDSISKVCSFTLTLAGDHIGAGLGISSPGFSNANALAGALDPDASFLVDGAVATSVDEAGSYTVKVTVTVDFPRGLTADNTTKDLSTALNDITVTATQSTV